MTTTQQTQRAQRAKGTPFEILYRPRAKPSTATAPAKRGPKPKTDQSYRARTLACLKDV